jgi:hypothetical protein
VVERIVAVRSDAAVRIDHPRDPVQRIDAKRGFVAERIGNRGDVAIGIVPEARRLAEGADNLIQAVRDVIGVALLALQNLGRIVDVRQGFIAGRVVSVGNVIAEGIGNFG